MDVARMNVAVNLEPVREAAGSRFERMRLRGLSGARDEFHLAAVVQNLKTLAKHIWRPPLREPTAGIV